LTEADKSSLNRRGETFKAIYGIGSHVSDVGSEACAIMCIVAKLLLYLVATGAMNRQIIAANPIKKDGSQQLEYGRTKSQDCESPP
jgi:hypothetical protein